MRNVLLGLAFITTILSFSTFTADAQRAPRPWCLRTSGTGPTGGLNECSYYSLEQCRMSLGGGTDHCFRNPDLAWDRIEGKRSGSPGRQPRGRDY